jgi:hypothetical protein
MSYTDTTEAPEAVSSPIPVHTIPANNKPAAKADEWKGYEKIAFRIAFLFFFILAVPLNIDYYLQWFNLPWAHLHIRDLGGFAGSDPRFLTINTESGQFGLASYVNWGITLLIAIAGGIIWTLADKKSTNYRVLYYFISVLVSFSMLARLNGLTFAKVFPTQMPELALTQLNTNLGDIVAQKLYWIQLSFVPRYEVFLGLAELLIMVLLFFRNTRALGAALAFSMIGNIAISNHVYDGGIHLAASYYAIGGIFVLWRYLPSIWKLLIKEKDTPANIYHFPFAKKWQRNLRYGLKAFVFGIFFLLSAYLHWQNYLHDSYKVPARPGLAAAQGLYRVTEFRVNNKVLPYSPLDSLRWQDVTFEKWSTLSFTVFNTFHIHGEAGRGKQFKDVDRTYESAGTGGGRRHYYYEADTSNQVLVLQNKNKVYANEKLVLHYDRPTATRIILSGLNQYRDSIYVVLDKREKQYPLYANRSHSFIDEP